MRLRRPLVCLVTDRSRLAAFGAPPAEAEAGPWTPLVELAGLAAGAGVDLIQVREPDLSSRDLLSLVTRILARVGASSTTVVVNDRADIAIAAASGGVHLKGESMPTGLVRRLVPDGMIVGRSVHTVEEAVEAARAGADYVVCGTVFETRSKAPGHRPAGLTLLERVVSAVPIPVLAIGGITVDRLAEVAATGAAGVAAIGLFHESAVSGPFASREPVSADVVSGRLEGIVAAVRRAFGDQ